MIAEIYICWKKLLNRAAIAGLIGFVSILSVNVVAQTATEVEQYRLDAGDRIAIKVFDENDLTLTADIGENGVINYSYLGNVVVAGKTTSELEKELISLLSDGYLVNPSVNVTVAQYRAFFIDGEVRRPGSYPYQPGLTLDKAISLAGGLTDRASKRKMYLIKANDRAQKSVRVKMNTLVQPGDAITIKEGFF